MRSKGMLIIVHALIWGLVIVAISWRLQGSGMFGDLIPILSSGAMFTMLVTVGHFASNKAKGSSSDPPASED
jgi:hypothetical protein